MKTQSGLKILTAATLVAALGGCMSVANDENATAQSAPARMEQVAVAAKAAVTGQSTQASNEQLAGVMEQIGCPKLANLFRDLSEVQNLAKADATSSLPQSFSDFFTCFEISSLTSGADYQKVEEAFEDFESLIDCICGSKALSNLIAGRYSFTGFGSVNSSAGGTGFGSTTSSAGGTGFGSTSSSAGGTGFGSSSSSAGGIGFGDQ